jgi:hypothetical protein
MRFLSSEELVGSFNRLISKSFDKSQHEQEETFFACQHFLFACCNRLRGFIEWPVVKDAYAKAKIGLGSRSGFMKNPGWNSLRAFRTKADRDGPQYAVFNTLIHILEHQDLDQLQWGLNNNIKLLFRHLPAVILARIWNDTVALNITPRVAAYPMFVRQMAHGIRMRDAYDETPYIGDWCEENGFDEEAKHFHNPECCHTYACRYLHNICKGMDGR